MFAERKSKKNSFRKDIFSQKTFHKIPPFCAIQEIFFKTILLKKFKYFPKKKQIHISDVINNLIILPL